MIVPVLVLALLGGAAVEAHRRAARRAQVTAVTAAIRLAENTGRAEDFERVAAMARPLGLQATEAKALRRARLASSKRRRRI